MLKLNVKRGIPRRTVYPIWKSLLACYRRKQDKLKFQENLRDTDVFLVGHPKSGNTWLAYMLAIVLHKDTEYQISLANVGEYVPTVHGRDSRIAHYPNLAQPRIFRNEWPMYPTLYPKTVYVLRDPRAVLVSLFHMYHVVFDDSQMTMQAFVNEYLVHGCIKKWEPKLVRWDKQVLAWKRRAEVNGRVLLVRYEDLVTERRRVLQELAEFACVPCAEEDLAVGVSRGSFEEMQANEDQHGAESYLRVKEPRRRFIRRGMVDSWKHELDPALAEQIETELAPAMRVTGYL